MKTTMTVRARTLLPHIIDESSAVMKNHLLSPSTKHGFSALKQQGPKNEEKSAVHAEDDNTKLMS